MSLPLPLVYVRFLARRADGTVVPGAKVRLTLTAYEKYDGVVVPSLIEADADDEGYVTLGLFPNALGANGTRYRVAVHDTSGMLLYTGHVVVPDVDEASQPVAADLVLDLPPYPKLDVVQQAVRQLQAAQATIAGQVDTVAQIEQNVIEDQDHVDQVKQDVDAMKSATEQARDLANEFLQLAQQAAAQGASYLNALFVEFASAAALTTALGTGLGYAQMAQAQASAAAASAASAASVAQQDLSATLARALYRAAAAPVAVAFMDTTRDSNPGWVKQTDAASFVANAVLTGVQTGWFASELLARGDNTLSYPEEQENAAYSKPSVAVTTSAILASDGVALMRRATSTSTAAGTHGVTRANAWSATSQQKSFSAEVRYDGSVQWVFVAPTTASTAGVYFDILNGVKGSEVGGITGTIVAAGSGWRLTITGTTALRTPCVCFVSANGAAITAYTGALTDSILTTFWKCIDGGPMTAYVPYSQQTGKVFGSSPDGKFYVLGATYATLVETLVGNKRAVPRLAALALASDRLIVFDVEEPGCPMWRVWGLSVFGAAQSVTYRDGRVIVGCANGLATIDLARDAGRFQQVGNDRLFALSDYSAPVLVVSPIQQYIAGSSVNAVAACTMPDAPFDAVTGLQVPTVAAATSGGISVIQNTGAVVNSGSSGNFSQIAITPNLLSAGITAGATLYTALKPGSLAAGFALSTTAPTGFVTGTPFGGLLNPRRDMIVKRSGARVSILKYNESNPPASLQADIADTYSTPWWVGAVIRAYGGDCNVGALSGSEKIVNGSFTTDLSNWTPTLGGTGSCAWQAPGVAAITADGSTVTYLSQQITCVPNVANQLVVDVGSNILNVSVGTTQNGSNVLAAVTLAVGSGQSVQFVPTTTSVWVTFFRGTAATSTIDNVSCKDVVADHSYQNKPIGVVGALARSQVATGSQLCGITGFIGNSAYLQEAYSASYDTGANARCFRHAFILPVAPDLTAFPSLANQALTGGWVNGGTTPLEVFSTSGGTQVTAGRTTAGGTQLATIGPSFAVTAGTYYRFTAVVSANTFNAGNTACYVSLASNASPASAWSNLSPLTTGTGTIRGYVLASNSGTAIFRIGLTNIGQITVDSVSLDRIGPAVLFDRSAPSGASQQFGCWPDGALISSLVDSVGATRTATTAAGFNTGGAVVVDDIYTTDGTLSLVVNGRPAAQAAGAPLSSLTNTSAVVTIGNARALNAAWPGTWIWSAPSATAPLAEQSAWMYEQEKEMWQPGALITLPDSGSVLSFDFDDSLNHLKIASAANDCSFNGRRRTSTSAASAGSITSVALRGGIKLVARSTTNPGVDITWSALNLKEELLRREEAAARRARVTATRDFSGGFTGNTTNGQTAITAVAGWVFPLDVNPVGMTISGTGIPAGAYITGVSGTTVYMSAAATATNTGTQIASTRFPAPLGYDVARVLTGGVRQREGSGNAFTREFDGFVERAAYVAAPGYNAWVQLECERRAA